MKRKYKRESLVSNKKIKKNSIDLSEINHSTVLLVYNLWMSYIKGFLRLSKGNQQIQTRIPQLELIGANVIIVGSCNHKINGLKGIIVNHSKNCYFIAKVDISSVSESVTSSVRDKIKEKKVNEENEDKTYDIVRVIKDEVDIAILLDFNDTCMNKGQKRIVSTYVSNESEEGYHINNKQVVILYGKKYSLYLLKTELSVSNK